MPLNFMIFFFISTNPRPIHIQNIAFKLHDSLEYFRLYNVSKAQGTKCFFPFNLFLFIVFLCVGVLCLSVYMCATYMPGALQ